MPLQDNLIDFICKGSMFFFNTQISTLFFFVRSKKKVVCCLYKIKLILLRTRVEMCN